MSFQNRRFANEEPNTFQKRKIPRKLMPYC